MKKLLLLSFLFVFAAMFVNIANAQDFSKSDLLKANASLSDEKKSIDTDFKLEDSKKEYSMRYAPIKLDLGITQQTNQSNAVRDEWLKRGGKISYVSVMATGIYFSMDVAGQGKMNGYGGGYSIFLNRLNLKIPEYTTGRSTWNTFNWGIGYDLVVYGLNYSTKIPPVSSMDINMTMLNIMFTGNFGWTWGIGHFVDEGNWKGIALTAKYRPSYTVSAVTTTMKMKPSNPLIPETSSSDASGQFNAGGFGFDVDFTSFSATMKKLAPKPRSKFSFFFLPPVGDNPLFISLSYGLVFYPRPRVRI